MKKTKFQIQFNTPAFLGDSTQSGRWRTPPFKAQLRQWWRVAYAAQQRFAVSVREMRDTEGQLFGHAWLENDSFVRDGKRVDTSARKSEVRIRLNKWAEGQLKSWDRLEAATVHHPEAEKVRYQVGPHAYLGYGPLDGRGGTKLQDKQGKPNAAIQANEDAELAIAFPHEQSQTLEHALQLMNLYGTVGGRSRNGWGSYSLQSIDGIAAPTNPTPIQALAKCLSVDWPHALGADNHGALVWQTLPHKDWTGVMRTLAEIKIKLRTQAAFKFPHAQPDGQVHDRHWLSYPITRHDVSDWKRKNLRLPNQLRFKVRTTADGQLVGVIFHMPHQPPAEFRPVTKTVERIWRQVHQHLDGYIKPAPDSAHLKLTRITA
jgi:CRISPR-associated protein Cmr1